MSNQVQASPLSDREIDDLLGATLHGPLPMDTMSRVFATLAELRTIRSRQRSAFALGGTHTYAILPVSQSAFNEIRALLAQAQYEHAFHGHPEGEVIDMHGIAVQAKP